MLIKQRHIKIIDILEKEGMVNTTELVKLFGVSSETIRKDLEFLDSQGVLSRVHGGAVSKKLMKTQSISNDYISLHIRNSINLQEKSQITKKAITFVNDGQVIGLDYGSTSQMMALELKNNFSNLTVVTNSIKNALILAENLGITIILLGGVLNRDEYTLTEDFYSILDNIHIDIMFMTVSGIDPVIGCTDQKIGEMKIQRQMQLSSSSTIILADSSKFGKTSLLKVCTLEDIDSIITDSGIDPDMEKKIKEAGGNLIIV